MNKCLGKMSQDPTKTALEKAEKLPQSRQYKSKTSKTSHGIRGVYLRWLVSSWSLGGNVAPDRLSRYKGLTLAGGQ